MSLLLLLNGQNAGTPAETFYVLDEEGNIITDEDGNKILLEEAP